jgi:hypothetical protein
MKAVRARNPIPVPTPNLTRSVVDVPCDGAFVDAGELPACYAGPDAELVAGNSLLLKLNDYGTGGRCALVHNVVGLAKIVVPGGLVVGGVPVP